MLPVHLYMAALHDVKPPAHSWYAMSNSHDSHGDSQSRAQPALRCWIWGVQMGPLYRMI